MPEETACSVYIHSSAFYIIVVLFLTDAPDLWILCLRMHEHQPAYACFRCHCITLCQLYSQCPHMTVIMSARTVRTVVRMAMMGMTIQEIQYNLLQCVVRAVAVSDRRLDLFE